ncbi:MAG: 3-deoxy-D-manno-octulosonic acid kinase [Paracoccaceae bacterium]|jgi:3-deoxy-D-manno-octulosonic acid kinase|nr:3-deoxy-D-manno-octulosonic acid kinase [Paracoccaceae bacterium]MDP5365040.1 3-deoxy-D-manno-octulosonic acid kinase [Paracoccaceae bacterium]
MAEITTGRNGGAVIWYDADLLPTLENGLFDPDWLARTGRLTGTSTGRNTAWFLRHEGRDMVLRHYWRGGMVGRIVKDLYLREAVASSRAMREFTLLDWMHGQGLPVPRPVAARFGPLGPWYRADLLMERLPDTRPLADLLAEAPLPRDVWARIGAVIAHFHKAGVHHSDLNCRNILLDGAGGIWLIDFDKCERRPHGRWAQDNIDRLERSLLKEKGKVPALHWSAADWQALLTGYHGAGQTDAGMAAP